MSIETEILSRPTTTLAKDRRQGLIALFLLAWFYAVFGVITRVLAITLATYQQIYLRTLVAFLVGLLVFSSTRKRSTWTNVSLKDWSISFLRAAITYWIGVGLFVKALSLTTLVNVSFLSAVPFVAVWGMLLFKEKPTFLKIALLLLSVIGTALVCLSDLRNILSWGRGEILTVISALGFSFGLISMRWHSHSLSTEMVGQLFLLNGSIATLILSLVLNEPTRISSDPVTIFTLLAAGVLLALTVYLGNFGFQRVSGIVSANILVLESPFALLLGFVIYSEVPSLQALAGGLLIAVSSISINAIELRQGRPERAPVVSAG